MVVGRQYQLKFKQATIGLVLILIIGGCMAASVYQQENSQLAFLPDGNLQVLLATPLLGAYAQGLNPHSVNSTRMDIYTYIDANPGIQFRGVCAGLTLPVGLVQYHLGVLVKSGLVSFVRDGKYKRFFVSKKFSKKQIDAITMLRHKTAKRIFEVLLNKKQLSHGKLADELAISSQALTWQMKSLRNTKFVLQVNDGLKLVYSINESTMPLLETSLAIVR
jgi:predicted transcriptional regulator